MENRLSVERISFRSMMKNTQKLIRPYYLWISPILDLRVMFRALFGYPRFFADYLRYRRMAPTEPLRFIDMRPCVSDRTATTDFDHHYIYMNGWAFRQISAARPSKHVDVGSQISFVTTLSAVVPVTFVDIRPLTAELSGLESLKGSILSLPFEDREVSSISSLHVIEHIGLGRYGDPLDPEGSRKAIKELARILEKNGSLYLGLPIGRERVCFNVHRVHNPVQIVTWFQEEGLTLKGFAAVNDQGRFLSPCKPEEMSGQEYACGMYHFVRPGGSDADKAGFNPERSAR